MTRWLSPPRSFILLPAASSMFWVLAETCRCRWSPCCLHLWQLNHECSCLGQGWHLDSETAGRDTPAWTLGYPLSNISFIPELTLMVFCWFVLRESFFRIIWEMHDLKKHTKNSSYFIANILLPLKQTLFSTWNLSCFLLWQLLY